ncbi:unnamed protein product [Rhodiola kirilowii]
MPEQYGLHVFLKSGSPITSSLVMLIGLCNPNKIHISDGKMFRVISTLDFVQVNFQIVQGR